MHVRAGWLRNSLARKQCRVRTMRNALAAACAACALASPVLAVETSNFNLATTRDLVALCSCEPDDPLYAEALQFCYGYMAGMAQLHRALVRADDIKPVACPRYEVTREELVRIFLDWARANPDAMDELPADSVKRAAAATWPCGG
jgi:Rap1a immunity proteins